MERFLKKPPAAAASASSSSSGRAGATPAKPAARRPPSDDDEDEEEDESEEEEKMPLPARFAKKPAAAAAASPAPSPQAPARRAPPPPATRRAQHEESDEDLSDEDDDDDDDASEDEDRDPSDHSEDDDEEEEDEEEDEDEDYSDEDAAAAAASSKKFRQPRLRFDLITFSAPQFDAGSFVSDLTRELFEQQDPLDFDPAPFSVLFDNALERLNVLRDETDRNIAVYAAEARAAEEQHKEGLANLQEQLGTVFTKFRRLDGRISSVAHTSVRIGHTLQSVDLQKKYNLQGQEIIQHFLAFHEASLLAANSAAAAQARLPAIFHVDSSAASASSSSLAGLKDTVPELHRAAELIQMLSAISQDLRVKGTEKASELIAKTSNEIENELISRFDRASRDKNLLDMKSHAGVLLNFRGKAIIKRYVFNVIEKLEAYCRDEQLKASRKHSVDDEQAGEAPTTAAAVAQAADEKSVVGVFKLSLLRLYRGVTFAIKEQCAVCAVIFPHPLSVIKSILERVFQDKIQGLIDSSLGDRRLQTEEFLRMLEFAHTNTQELVANLQQAIRTVATGLARDGGGGGGGGASGGGGLGASSGGHHRSSSVATSMLLHSPASPASSLFSSSSGSGSSSSSSGQAADQVQMMNLSDQVSGIFAVYRSQAHEREMHLVKEVCHRLIQSTLALEAPRSHAASSAAHPGDKVEDETDMFGRVKKSILADQKQKWVLLVLESDLVEKLCAQSIASVSRADKLSEPSLLAEHVSDIFTHIASAALDDFLSTVLHAALEFLPPLDGKTEPDPFFFQVIGLINLMVDKIALHFQLWILPRVSGSGGGAGAGAAGGAGSGAGGLLGGGGGLIGSLNSTGGGGGGGGSSNTAVILDTRLRDLFSHVETQICQALVRLLQASLKYLTRLWSQKQRAQDYRPREDDAESVLDGKPSAACAAVCSFLSTQYASIVTSLEGKNLDKYLTILGLKVAECFVSHLQKHSSVSLMGAGLLARDMKEYQRVMGSFHLAAVLDKWSELRQVVDLFFVGPDYLRAVIADSSKLRNMDPAALLAFIAIRADFADNKKRILAALNLKEGAAAHTLQTPAATATAADGSNRSRGNSAWDD